MWGDARTFSLLLPPVGALGVEIAIDDFGTGYSSLGCLHQLPLCGLKIDRAFIQDLRTHAEQRRVFEAIVGIARSLGLEVTAEGIETAEQLAVLRNEGLVQTRRDGKRMFYSIAEPKMLVLLGTLYELYCPQA